MSVLSGVTLAQTEEYPVAPPVTPAPPPQEARPLTPFTYARILTGPVTVYQHPTASSLGDNPLRSFDEGYVWVTLQSTQTITHENQVWYAINPDEYVTADSLEIFTPSSFKGQEITTPQQVAWIVYNTFTSPAPGGAYLDENSVRLKRYELVNIQAVEDFRGRNWYQVDNGQWVEQGNIGIASPKPRPKGVGRTEKWIEVDLYEQTLTAYEGDRMVYATLVSSGLPWWETRTGLYRIWAKTDRHKMSGREGFFDYYFLEDVPWTMYFNENIALHGAYWHDRFGSKQSHGCVNLSLADAKWLFEWTSPAGKRGWSLPDDDEPGTWVWVHDGQGGQLAEVAESGMRARRSGR